MDGVVYLDDSQVVIMFMDKRCGPQAMVECIFEHVGGLHD